MISNGLEKKLLKKLSENLLMRKEEVIQFLREEEVEDAEEVFRVVMNGLVSKGLVRYVYAGESCYTITQKGMREVS